MNHNPEAGASKPGEMVSGKNILKKNGSLTKLAWSLYLRIAGKVMRIQKSTPPNAANPENFD